MCYICLLYTSLTQTFVTLDFVVGITSNVRENGVKLLITVSIPYLPVSYTHLDVYKRQISHHLGFSHRTMRYCALMRY